MGRIPMMEIGRLEGMYAVDNVGFEEEGSVFVGTDECIDHLRCRIAPDRMNCDLYKVKRRRGTTKGSDGHGEDWVVWRRRWAPDKKDVTGLYTQLGPLTPK